VDALVHVVPAQGGVNVTLYDVPAGRSAGSEVRRLTGTANSPDWRWSVHGVADDVHEWITRERGFAQTRIAFTRGGELRVIDSDGAMERVVERGEIMSPSWHPTEPVLAFSAFSGSGWRIGVKPLTGGNTRWMTSDATGANFSPVFSPDGTRIFYARQVDEGGNILSMGYPQGPRISIMRRSSNISSPTLNPEGSQIIYVTNQLGGNPHLYVMGADGAGQEPVAPFTGEKTHLESPAWSPNGILVAYQVRRGNERLYSIETMDIRSKAVAQHTNSSCESEDPTWAPDGRHIVFVSTRGSCTGRNPVRELYILDTKSGQVRQLTRGGSSAVPLGMPAWSPRLPREP
jgi:TolB protein